MAAASFSVPANATGVQSNTVGTTSTATSSISATPLPFDSTNGDILAITKVAGAKVAELAIGGNFTQINTTDGPVAATNFAVINELTGAVLYRGDANSYVRAIATYRDVIYIGGNFTKFGSSTRSHLVALNSTFAVTSWNPAPFSPVRAIAADAAGVYYGGDGATVRKAALSTGKTIWSQAVTGGPVYALQLTGDDAYLFVGGVFQTYDHLTRHGLIKASVATGAPITAFNAKLKPNTTATSGNGQQPLSFALAPDQKSLVVGIGGAGQNEVRKVNIVTGAVIWRLTLPGDGEAAVQVGDTYVLGYHDNSSQTTFPHFAAQFDGTTGATTNWNPQVTGNQPNTDGGNQGVQAAYADPTTGQLFLAGAFTTYAKTDTTRQSLIEFSWTKPTTVPAKATYTASDTLNCASGVVTVHATAKTYPSDLIDTWVIARGKVVASNQHATAAATGAWSGPVSFKPASGVHSVTVELTGPDGRTPLELKKTLTWKVCPSKLSITRSHSIRKGSHTTVSGHLTVKGTRDVVSGGRVSLYERTSTKGKFHRVTTLTTSSKGFVRKSLKPSRTTYYEWVYAGSSVRGTARTSVEKVTVKK